MGWYLRKYFRLGPLRINLSKSGLGASAGVTGLRVGTGPKGRYLHAGRGGLYFRRSFGSASSEQADSGQQPSEPSPSEEPPPLKDGLLRRIRRLLRGR